MTLYKKVMLFILLLILPLNIVAISVTRKAMDTTVEQIEMVDQRMADITLRDLSAKMDNAFSLLYYFATGDVDCIQMMRQKDDAAYTSAKLQFFVSLQNLTHMTDGADGYFYYLEKKDDMLFCSNEAGTDRLRADMLTPLVTRLENRQWTICEVGQTTYLFYMQKKSNTCYGAWINLDTIRDDLVSSMDQIATQAYFTHQEEPALLDGCVGTSVTRHGVTLTILQQRKDVLRDISPESRFLYITALVYLLAVPLLCGFVNRLLLRPLKLIRHANQELQSGNLDYRIVEKASSPEYEQVFNSFNAMAQDLKTTKFACFQKETEKQKLELRNLQLQIRPHFLLNIFNLIYALAQRGESEQIQDTILYLSDYFRYIFRSNSEMETFEKERGILTGYLMVANFRYHDLIRMEFDVTPKAEKVCVPPLLLHNFIENTVKHGVRQGKELHILLKGRCENGMATFWIRDDGNGMDAKTLQRNRAVFHGKLDLENKHEHIGLYYSYRRLKSCFGEQASIDVESQQNVGTCFTIRFPCASGGEDEPADRE